MVSLLLFNRGGCLDIQEGPGLHIQPRFEPDPDLTIGKNPDSQNSNNKKKSLVVKIFAQGKSWKVLIYINVNLKKKY